MPFNRDPHRARFAPGWLLTFGLYGQGQLDRGAVIELGSGL